MDVTQLSNKTIELSDITAWDKNGNKLLVSKVRARNIVSQKHCRRYYCQS
jgi:hypothetical protein